MGLKFVPYPQVYFLILQKKKIWMLRSYSWKYSDNASQETAFNICPWYIFRSIWEICLQISLEISFNIEFWWRSHFRDFYLLKKPEAAKLNVINKTLEKTGYQTVKKTKKKTNILLKKLILILSVLDPILKFFIVKERQLTISI